MAAYFGGVVSVVLLSPLGGALVVGGGRAEPAVLDGAGLAGLEPGSVVVLEAAVLSLLVGAVVAAADVVAEAFAPDVLAELLDAIDWPAHQSFFARWAGEAFR